MTRNYPSFNLTGSLSTRIKEGLAKGKLSDSQIRIARTMMEDWSRTAWAPATQLAQRAGCNKSTVSRFIRQLGYSDHAALQRAAQSAASHETKLTDPDIDESKTSWLMQGLARLEHDAKAHSVNLEGDVLEHHADQVQFVAARLSRAKRIVIIAATEDAKWWLPAVYDLFVSSLTIPVFIDRSTHKWSPKQGDHKLLLHIGNPASSSRPELSDWALAKKDGYYAAHLVVGSAAAHSPSDTQRVLHVDDRTDHLAGFAMLINTCIIIIREIAQRDSSKARETLFKSQT